MNVADRRKIGTIDLVDLDVISRFYGRESLPYPLMRTRPSKFLFRDEYIEYAKSVPDRFDRGDLAAFQQCAGSYAHAEIRVECHVQFIPADTPSVRVLAFRLGQAGFLASQRPDDDAVDVHELSPYLLGSAVAEAVGLRKPGHRSAIAIPEYRRTTASNEIRARVRDGFEVAHPIDDTPSVTEVARSHVTAYGTVQSHWRPARGWGMDPHKNHALWVRIREDGDYLFAADCSLAKPVATPELAERIDRLISQDVKALRRFRNG